MTNDTKTAAINERVAGTGTFKSSFAILFWSLDLDVRINEFLYCFPVHLIVRNLNIFSKIVSSKNFILI